MAKVWETERLVIRESAAVTAREIADFHRRNREFMKVYAPAREDAYYTEAFWQQELRDELAEESDGRSCLKHTIEGDYNLVSAAEVESLMNGSGSGRVQR